MRKPRTTRGAVRVRVIWTLKGGMTLLSDEKDSKRKARGYGDAAISTMWKGTTITWCALPLLACSTLGSVNPALAFKDRHQIPG
jgi:hypothetical protein